MIKTCDLCNERFTCNWECQDYKRTQPVSCKCQKCSETYGSDIYELTKRCCPVLPKKLSEELQLIADIVKTPKASIIMVTPYTCKTFTAEDL